MTDPVAAIYAKLPAFTCKGLCQASCGAIPCSFAEAVRLQDNCLSPPELVDHPTNGPFTCSHLDPAGRCGIYEDRPMVCRLFGMIPAMRCPYGCKPVLTDQQGEALMVELERLSCGRKPHYPAALEEAEVARLAALRRSRKN